MIITTFHYAFHPMEIPEVLRIVPRIWPDDRGFFMENYTRKEFEEGGIPHEFVQDNTVRSTKGVLRGMHMTRSPHQVAKLVRCLEGAIFDVAVDARRDSPTFGKWVGAELTGENMEMLYIPPGFLHGYLVMSDQSLVHYKQTQYYHPDLDAGMRFDDPAVGILWPFVGPLSVNDRDRSWPDFGTVSYQ